MNKKLLQSVREYKKQSIIAPLLVTLEVLMEVLIPLEMAKIIDIGIAEGNLGYIIQRGLILVIMAMMSLFFGVQAGNFAAIAGAGYAKNLRHDIYYKVQDFSFKNIDHFSTSGLVTRMTTDITNIQMAYMMSIRLLARAPIMIVLSWIMTLTLSKKAALLFLIVIPVLGGTLLFIAKKAHPHFIKVFDEYDDLNGYAVCNVCRYHDPCLHWWKRHCNQNDGNRCLNLHYCICFTDHRLPDDGNFRFRHDYDCWRINRPYHRGTR